MTDHALSAARSLDRSQYMPEVVFSTGKMAQTSPRAVLQGTAAANVRGGPGRQANRRLNRRRLRHRTGIWHTVLENLVYNRPALRATADCSLTEAVPSAREPERVDHTWVALPYHRLGYPRPDRRRYPSPFVFAQAIRSGSVGPIGLGPVQGLHRTMRAPRVLVFQHMEAGHPGVFRDFLRRDGIAWQTVRLDLDESIPDLAGFDALWVMGGPQDVWQEAEHPWLVAEKAAIREAALARLPVLGICLGHQLLADALGGAVRPAAAPEIGVFEVTLNDGAADSPLLFGLPARGRFLQWHRAEVHRPPDRARVLAASTNCAIQALAIGERAFGLQFHAEVDEPLLDEWLRIPAAVADLESGLGPGGPDRFAADAYADVAAFRRAARQLYVNFRTLLPVAAPAPGSYAAAPAPPRRPPPPRPRAP